MKLIDLTYRGRTVDTAADAEAITTYLAQVDPFDEDTLLFMQNKPSVIIGRLQDAYTEVNLDKLRQKNIQLVRRAAGGGAVYMDEGSFVYIFSIAEGKSMAHRLDYAHYAQPLIQTLQQFGIKDVALSGRNDVTIGGRKVSGMAGFQVRTRFNIGGTIIFRSSSDVASQVLTPIRSKFESKGFKSVASRITDVQSSLPDTLKQVSTQDFQNEFLKNVFDVTQAADVPRVTFSQDDWNKINQLKETRYDNDVWNLGRQPHYPHYVRKHYDHGTVAINFDTDGGKLTHVLIFGDFFTPLTDLSTIEEALVGTELTENALGEAYQKAGVDQLLPWMTSTTFAELMLSKEN
ncbi:MAG TPA: hypothetical protein DCW31_07760 [Lactobacillus sp.]|nr:hypothetical protein [Lactobacillus sp.]